MSLQTWKEEFYPVEADKVSKEQALAHSLKKWQGLTDENLSKHNVFHICRRIRSHDNEYDMLLIDAGTCALCQHYAEAEESCANCPLTKTLYPTGEWEDGGDEPCGEHYVLFVGNNKTPKPMIDLLTKAFEQEQKNAQASQVQNDQDAEGPSVKDITEAKPVVRDSIQQQPEDQEFGHEVVNPNIQAIIKERSEDQ